MGVYSLYTHAFGEAYMFKKVLIFPSLFLTITIPLSQEVLANDNIKKAGDITVALLPAITYGTTFYLDDTEGRAQLYKSFFSNLTLTEILKQSVRRERPNKHDRKSFPSGHTSVSFQTATFIYQRYGWKPAIPAYIAASFVGYSRIKSDWHYGNDVLAGAIVGAATSYYFTGAYHGFQITPSSSLEDYGITLRKYW